MRKVAIYGKGGIGKSTTTQNTVAGLAEMDQSADPGFLPETRQKAVQHMATCEEKATAARQQIRQKLENAF